MSTSNLLELGQPAVMKNVGRLPVVFTRGQGSRLWDADGKEYIDLLTGISVHNFGHSHPAITEALVRQAGKIIHVSNYFYLEEQLKLAAGLTRLTGFQQVFFSNSGAEANEAALKLARKHGKIHLNGKYQIVTACDSFHGRTYGALSATGQPKYQASFQPVVPGFKYAAMNDIESWKAAIGDESCAILIELVQGEGGVVPAAPGFIAELVAFCRERQVLVMVDEVQTGFGRTGKLFAYQHFNFQPDVITIAKTLGGGIPCGALLVTEQANLFEPGDHSTTVGGGAMAFAAGLTVLELLQEPGLMDEVNRKGQYIRSVWEEWRQELPSVKGPRGLGMMLALDLNVPSKPVMLKCLERGLVVNAVTDTAIRILPALNIPMTDLDEALGILKQVLREFS